MGNAGKPASVDGRSRSDRQADERARTRVLPRARTVLPPGAAGNRNVNFRTAVRGYDRREVDRYVERVNREIAELEIASSPESAVRHALDQVGEQTAAILQRARVSADEIVEAASLEAEHAIERAAAEAREILAAAQAEADGVRSEAGRDAGELIAEGERELASARKQASEERAQAERDAREVQAHIDTIGEERRDLVEEVHELAARLEAVADFGAAADARRHDSEKPPLAGGEAEERERKGAGADADADGRGAHSGAAAPSNGARQSGAGPRGGKGGPSSRGAKSRAAAARAGEPAGVEVWADQQADA